MGKFDVGDIVVLRSNPSIKMTVGQVGEHSLLVLYFNPERMLCKDWIPSGALTVADNTFLNPTFLTWSPERWVTKDTVVQKPRRKR